MNSGAALATALAALVVAGVVACPPGPSRAARHQVEIRQFAFQPETLRIQPGDTVVWINHDLFPHTATAEDSSWTTGTLAQGDSARVVIGPPGKAVYFCEFHSGMTGTILLDR